MAHLAEDSVMIDVAAPIPLNGRAVGHTAVLLERRCLILGGRRRTHTRQAPALGLSPR
jgi:hypothetical protein